MSITDKILEFISLTIQLGSYILSIVFAIYLFKKYHEYKEKYKDDDR